MIQVNAAWIIQVIACMVMCFSWGAKVDFEEGTKKRFTVLIWVCIAAVWAASLFR